MEMWRDLKTLWIRDLETCRRRVWRQGWCKVWKWCWRETGRRCRRRFGNFWKNFATMLERILLAVFDMVMARDSATELDRDSKKLLAKGRMRRRWSELEME